MTTFSDLQAFRQEARSADPDEAVALAKWMAETRLDVAADNAVGAVEHADRDHAAALEMLLILEDLTALIRDCIGPLRPAAEQPEREPEDIPF